MDIRKLQRAIVDGLEDVKAQDILVYNTEHLSPLFERVIIASGQSNRQTKALASSVRQSVKSQAMAVLRTEGEENGEWIIVDCGAAIAHIMQPSIREYYRLEEIWGDKPVKIKLGAARGGLVKASGNGDADDDGDVEKPVVPKKPAARKKTADTSDQPASKKAAPKKAVAKKAVTRKAAEATAEKAVALPARKAAPAPAKKTGAAPRRTAAEPVKAVKAVKKVVVGRPAGAAKKAAPARKTPTRRA